MMKGIVILFLTLIFFSGRAQDKGIIFETGFSWREIKAKAKAENKYIFMDCYATWCGPCKKMAIQIFPQKEVGDYFNSNFISVAVQMDKTDKDSSNIRKWYSDASELAAMYQIVDFPTYLFFSPEGNVVHRVVGSIENADEFIRVGKNALDPTGQYYSLIEQYKSHTEDSVYLLHAMKTAIDATDMEHATAIANYYFQSLKYAITIDNIQLVYRNRLISNTRDYTFELFLNNALNIDSIMKDNYYAERALGAAIFREQIMPLYFKKPTILFWNAIAAGLKDSYPTIGSNIVFIEEQEFRAGIKRDMKAILKAEKTEQISWGKIYDTLKRKYPDYDVNQLFLEVKAWYCFEKKKWAECGNTTFVLMHQYGNRINDYTINNMAWDYVFVHCSDPKIIKEAIKWMKRSVERAPERGDNLDTYAHLLYKLGKVEEAIVWENKAIEKLYDQGDIKTAKIALSKMKKGEPIWDDAMPEIQN